MKKFIFTFYFILLSSQAFSQQIISLQVKPDNELFIKEDRQLLFEVKLENKESPDKIWLAELGFDDKDRSFLDKYETKNKGPKIIRYVWELNDQGLDGDLKAHDGIYSRKISFKEKNSSVLEFIADVRELKPRSTPPVVFDQAKTVVKIKDRPSFIEMLSQAWEKFKLGIEKKYN